MRHPEFPVVSFLCLFLLLCLSPPHIKSGKISIIALLAWMAVLSLIRGVNSLAWAGNFDVKLKVWCDITTKITMGFSLAIPAAALCVLHQLESIVSARQAQFLKSDRRKRQKIEALICFGFPILFMALHYVVQGHRFDLIEDFGCQPAVYDSVVALCLIYLPPLLISVTSLSFAGKSLYYILRRRAEFASNLQSHAGISSGTFFRLMALSITVTLWDTTVNAYIIHLNVSAGLRPWKSWGDVHSNFSRIQAVPAIFITPYENTQLLFEWWILPVSCILFCLFFGFGREAMSNYQAGIVWFRRRVLRQDIREPPSYRISGLPSYNVGGGVSSTNIPSPSTSGKNLESKPWDALSLDMPEGTDADTSSTLTSKDPFALSLDEHSTPVVMSELPFVNPSIPPSSGGNTTQTDVHENVPSVVITKPSNAALRRDVSPATCTRASTQSMTTDSGITVSPAYIPDAGSASRYHEETFLARDSQGTAPVSDGPLQIQITVEKGKV